MHLYIYLYTFVHKYTYIHIYTPGKPNTPPLPPHPMRGRGGGKRIILDYLVRFAVMHVKTNAYAMRPMRVM